MTDNKYWYLRNHKLFETLSQADIDSLCIISNMKNIEKNDIVFFAETEIKRIFIIKVGTLKICKEDANGKEIITEILTEGDIFGQIYENTDKSTTYAKALSNEVKLCFFEAENFKRILNANPDLSISFSSMIQEKLISFQQKYESLIFKDVDTRVKDFFKRYASYHGINKDNTIEMEMLLTHQDIADYTASSRQSVTTIINNLAEQGKIIYEGRKKVIIPNIKNLD